MPALATTIQGAPTVSIVVCAWCAHYGRAHSAARAPLGGEWHSVSHEYARAQKRTGTASHGVCAACKPLVARDWGIDVPPRYSWRDQAAA
jgi:hypothetical protein